MYGDNDLVYVVKWSGRPIPATSDPRKGKAPGQCMGYGLQQPQVILAERYHSQQGNPV